jgi:hypothetical protein
LEAQAIMAIATTRHDDVSFWVGYRQQFRATLRQRGLEHLAFLDYILMQFGSNGQRDAKASVVLDLGKQNRRISVLGIAFDEAADSP